ncbi:hypothetical protein ACFL6L_00850 [candidate division KSB1 bacterium]
MHKNSSAHASLYMITFALILLLTGTAFPQLQFKGYLENRMFITFIDNNFNPADYKESIRWGDFNRGRLEMSADVSDNSYINLTVDHYTYHGYLLQLLRQPGSGNNPVTAAEDQKIQVDRAYIKLYFDKADVTLGKQRISWGQSLLWSPFDVFKRVNFLEPQEEKPGVNALRVTVPLGVTSSFTGVFAPEATADESRAGARFIWNLSGSEFAVTGIHNVINTISQNIYGFSVKTDMVLGLWFEGAYFKEKPLPGRTGMPADYYRWLTGADYSLNLNSMKLLISAEYTHDESGEPHRERYNYFNAIMRGRTLLARDYVYGSAQLMYSDHTSFSTTVLSNINDRGIMFMPAVRHSLFPNTEMTIGMYAALAEAGDEFEPLPVNDPFNYIGNGVIYCWLRLYI